MTLPSTSIKSFAQEGNLFYSPYSISLAVAMTYAGARGETEQQMAQALGFVLSQNRLHPAFSHLTREFASRSEGASGKDESGTISPAPSCSSTGF